MTLQALLVSTDDSAADVLGRILPAFGIALDRSSNTETAIARIEQQKFDALLLDFGDATTADCVLQEARRIGSGQLPLTGADAARFLENTVGRSCIAKIQQESIEFLLFDTRDGGFSIAGTVEGDTEGRQNPAQDIC